MAPSTQGRKFNANSQPHVGVVGAGLSGLRCADILLKHGFKVTMIEGRDRVGGRVHQDKLPNGFWVDAGPNWIHGTVDNPILDIAKETQTSAGDFETSSYVFNENGELLATEEAGRYSEIMWNIIGEAFKHSNALGTAISTDESLLDFFNLKLKEMIPESDLDYQLSRKTVLQMCELWGAFVGSPIRGQSLRYFWLEECIEGENLFCSGTYKKILEHIARPAHQGADVKLKTTVKRVLSRTSPGEHVAVEVEGGQKLAFDEVVVTCPLGWLKQYGDAFEPRLPPRLTKAIESIGYGCLEKVYISFPTAFWLSQKDNNHFVQGFIQWLAPKYDGDANPSGWLQQVVELASLGPVDGHATLLFYTFGEQSQHLTNAVAKLGSKVDKDEFLLKFFKPYYSRMPGYVEGSSDCTPSYCIASDWLHDELAGNGSYCNFQVGLQEGDEDIKTMRHGLPEQGLWFAGEHTAPFVGLGTATGAYWSGELVGKRIAEAYGLSLQDG